MSAYFLLLNFIMLLLQLSFYNNKKSRRIKNIEFLSHHFHYTYMKRTNECENDYINIFYTRCNMTIDKEVPYDIIVRSYFLSGQS